MGIHLTLVALGAISNDGGSTPISAVRAALAKLGIELPDLQDGEHDVYLENPESSNPHVSEDASFSVAGGGVTHIGIFRPCSLGIRALCYELMASGFIIASSESLPYATVEALRNFPVLSDKRQFPHGFISISGPDDFLWVTNVTIVGSV